jgi:hypothetical protein
MKSITIHHIDADLAEAIEALTNTTGLSQEEVVRKLLRKALGLESPPKPRGDLSAFYGVWTKEEAAEFEEAMKDFKQIDKDLWK